MSTTSPAIMTYQSLRQQILDTLQRNDQVFIDNLSNFIYQAEQTIAASVKDLGQLQYARGTGLTSVLQKPINWRQTQSMRVIDPDTNAEKYLIEKTYEFCRLFDSEVISSYPMLLPEYYSDYNYNTYFISHVRTSNANSLQLEIAYYAYPVFLSEINQTNYWTDFYPSALLYACLSNACVFLRMDDRAAGFSQLFNSEVSALNVEDTNRINDGSFERKGSIQKIPKQLN